MSEVNQNFLSEEQKLFIDIAKSGKNILVDACIGSGKTTAIQHLCAELPENLNILYLTYNRLLKLDANERIKEKNVDIQNYHGFSYMALKKIGISASSSDSIKKFLSNKPKIKVYDILLIDEYQDIDTEISELLLYIKSFNPKMQIIAVGDMSQKVYDKTNLKLEDFIKSFLENYITLEFTQCFRLSAEFANMLGRVWNKQIKGVNDRCVVETMQPQAIVEFLSKQEPKDILCLGCRTGVMVRVLNKLEELYPTKFNKNTVYASIRDSDSNASPKKTSAIFTTFDSSKGIERPILVVFDFSEEYWNQRINQPMQKYEILRNIFCVAASRGKNHIIFSHLFDTPLSEKTLKTKVEMTYQFDKKGIKELFEFKNKEDIEEAFKQIKTENITSKSDNDVIDVKSKDGQIDLSPCIGIYQEAVFFNGYDIDKEIDLVRKARNLNVYTGANKNKSIEKKVLELTALETKQKRYEIQVEVPFIKKRETQRIIKRLKDEFREDEQVQQLCSIEFAIKEDGQAILIAVGLADVVKNDVVYELKFVNELKHEHFLQCACYMIGLNLTEGVLWNIRDNTKYKIIIPDKTKFLDAVIKTATKGRLKKYFIPKGKK